MHLPSVLRTMLHLDLPQAYVHLRDCYLSNEFCLEARFRCIFERFTWTFNRFLFGLVTSLMVEQILYR
jgi:hypothetical protein